VCQVGWEGRVRFVVTCRDDNIIKTAVRLQQVKKLLLFKPDA
jgi:hypothetical protein